MTMLDGRYCLGCDLSCQEFMEPEAREHPHGESLSDRAFPQTHIFHGPPSPSKYRYGGVGVVAGVAIYETFPMAAR